MDAYIVSHNGLGDNLFMLGGLNFIKNFYRNIYFLCKKCYYKNVILFFEADSNIKCVPFNVRKEKESIKKILKEKYEDVNNDIFICGFVHRKYLKSRINNRKFLDAKRLTKKYDIRFDTITKKGYWFIDNFYKNMKLNLAYFYEYFYLPESEESKKLYEMVKDYYIVFIQYKTSNNKKLNISNLLEKYLNDEKTLLICNDINLYSKENKKYSIAQKFVLNKIIYYLDVIKNSDEIYIIDSCFTGIVLPLLKTNKLKAKVVRIILRNLSEKFKL